MTARPSWARVKQLIEIYSLRFGSDSIRVALAGSALSRNYGDITSQIPSGINFVTFPTLLDSDQLSAVALSAFNISDALSKYWHNDKPSAVLVIADRTETLGVSAASAIHQIPLIHLQGGEVSGSIDNKIRDTNSKLADLHLTTNDYTKSRLISIGENASDIFVVGCPSIDLVSQTLARSRELDIQRIPGVGANILNSEAYGIVMFHPDTIHPIDNPVWLNALIEFIKTSSHKWFWFWPNPDNGSNFIAKTLRRARESGLLKNVRFVINLHPSDFILLAYNAKFMIGNSSFAIREGSYLGLPSANIGKRQQGRQMSNNVLNLEELNNVNDFHKLYEVPRGQFALDTTYGDGRSGEKISEVLGSWIPTLKGV